MSNKVNGWTNENTYLVGVMVINDPGLHSLASEARDAEQLKNTMCQMLMEEPTSDDAVLALRRGVTRDEFDHDVDWDDILNSL